MLKPGDLRHILHQFCNVLQPIGYHVERLSELKTDDPVFNNAMKTLPKCMTVLYRIIERLRILSKPLELHRASYDLGALVNSVWLDISGTHPFPQLKVIMELPPRCNVNIDAYWLRLALRELFINAAEAALHSSHPVFAVRLADGGESWLLEIEDSGTGIPGEAAQNTLFFTTKSETGSGLGLPIARHIIEAHEARLQLALPNGARNGTTLSLPKSL